MKTLHTLLVSSRPLSWVNTAFPFAAAYLLTAGQIDEAVELAKELSTDDSPRFVNGLLHAIAAGSEPLPADA